MCVYKWGPLDISGKDYWYAIVSAVIGTILGILWAWWRMDVNSRESAKHKVDLLAESIAFNVALIKIALDKLNEGKIPNFPLDSIAFMQRLAEASVSIPAEITKDINWQRFQTEHITRKIDYILTSSPKTGVGIAPDPQLIADLRSHLLQCEKDLTTLISKLGPYGKNEKGA